MRRLALGLLIAVGSFAVCRQASAHFLFVYLTPPAEAGRAAEVYFSEQAVAGDPRFIDKIAGTRLWAQSEPGKFTPLTPRQLPDRLRAALGQSARSVSVTGVCTYGVLHRPVTPPFLLRHYPKAVQGKAADLNRLEPHSEVPLEIIATFDGPQITLVARRDGRALPGAVFDTVDADLAGTQLTADEEGRAVWTPDAPGRYSVYTRHRLDEPGTHEGEEYKYVLEFATLAFDWPLEPSGVDEQAVKQFEAALSARAKWTDFPGFQAEVEGEVGGRRYSGEVTVKADGDVEVAIDDDAVMEWVYDQLSSLVIHRLPASHESADTSPHRMRFGDQGTDHPLGPLLVVDGGEFASSYRVRDRQIMVVNREFDGENVTITVLDNHVNQEGQFLPHCYSVRAWNSANGELIRDVTVVDRWHRVGQYDLPSEHTTTTATDAGLTTDTMRLTNHQLID